jgi:hypothetical protein
VKGYVDTSADWSVAALKKVVFPVLVLPISPSLINPWPESPLSANK